MASCFSKLSQSALDQLYLCVVGAATVGIFSEVRVKRISSWSDPVAESVSTAQFEIRAEVVWEAKVRSKTDDPLPVR